MTKQEILDTIQNYINNAELTIQNINSDKIKAELAIQNISSDKIIQRYSAQITALNYAITLLEQLDEPLIEILNEEV